MDMNKIYKAISFFFIGMMIVGVATAVVVNIDGSNLTPLSWFSSNKTVWDAKGNASIPIDASNSSQLINLNATVNPYSFNAANATGVLPNASIPASAMNFTSSWNGVSFQNSWTNYGAGYETAQYKKIGNIVFVKGLITNTTWNANTIFTLPSGYTPLETYVFIAMAQGSTALQIDVTTNGNVNINGNKIGTGTGGYVSLNFMFYTG